MGYRSWLAAVILASYTQVALAQVPIQHNIPVPQLELEYTAPPLVPVPDGDDIIVDLPEGIEAPFSGQLFHPSTALRWANYLVQAKERLVLDVVHERRKCSILLKYSSDVLQLEREYSGSIELDLRTRLTLAETHNLELKRKMDNPGFFSSPGFWFSTGVLSTVVVVGLGVLAASWLK